MSRFKLLPELISAPVGACLAFLSLLGPAPVLSVQQAATQFRIYTDEPGVYRVAFEDLQAAGPVAATQPSAELALSNRGGEVAVWVEDGGDGRFGPGDWFEFVATQLPGTESYVHEYSTLNVYQLRLAGAGGERMTPALAREASGAIGERSAWRRQVHLEWDRLLVRLSADQVGDIDVPEIWFWEKLTHLAREALRIPLDFPGLAASGKDAVNVAVHMRALSSQTEESRTELPDHRVNFILGGRSLGFAEWDGRERYLSQLEPFPSSLLRGPEQSLAMKIPRRRPPDSPDPLVDVVMLNWIELDYPHDGLIGEDQVQLMAVAREHVEPRIASAAGADLVAYGAGGARIELPGSAPGYVLDIEGEESFWVLSDESLVRPARIEVDQPSQLADTGQQADYLILAHGRLIESAARLAELHRANGLEVALIDIQDVYDEFGDGIVHPQAIKKFISHAFHNWQQPRPRYVLLVGDASWDTKNATVDDARYANWTDRQLFAEGGFRAQKIETFGPEGPAGLRNLIPTFDFHTREGHAASDNWYVTVDGDDMLPDLAIGRLPVVDAETLDGIIGKIVRYSTESKVGPWRRNVLWITNEWGYLQEHTSSIEEDLRPRGLAATKIFPTSEEESNEHHQSFLSEALDAGQLLVHFTGHGGRYIWRTGPRDLGSKNYDLFTLDHVEALVPNDRIPVVFSVTCHSGPFDHPNADSIAEAFLRLPDRGAIAVVAASWRTSAASVNLSREMMTEFTRGGAIGDAFQRAKRNLEIEDLIATYNLLGDPGLDLALPESKVELWIEETPQGRLLSWVLDRETFEGRGLVDFVDVEGNIVRTEEVSSNSPRGELPWPPDFELGTVRAYLWSEADNIDGLGTLVLAPSGPEPGATPGS